MPPLVFDRYHQCVEDALATADLGVPGIVPHLRANCWCSLGLGEVVKSLGCCEHPDFKELCLMQCEPDCGSADALRCLDECPALCLESHYAAATCGAACAAGGCHRFLRCVTSEAVNLSASGSGSRVCHERDFVQAPEMRGYLQCRVAQSQKTAWRVRNAAGFCACSARVAHAAGRSRCCATPWGRELCERRCDDVNCTSHEARECASSCAHLCQGRRVETSGPCYEKCFRDGGECSGFAVCEPRKPARPGYICDDGRAPLTSGCCQRSVVGKLSMQCPVTCDTRLTEPIIVTATPGLYVAQAFGGFQCTCGGCPTTLDEVHEKLERLIRAEIYANGANLLDSIARSEGLELPTRAMRQLMRERNEAILRELELKSWPADKAFAIWKANSVYLTKIEAAARGPDAASGHSGGHGAGGGGGSVDATLLSAVIAVLGGLVLLLACLVVVIVRRTPQVATIDLTLQVPSDNSHDRSAAHAGDSLAVVMGHPVALSGSWIGTNAATKGTVAAASSLPHGRSDCWKEPTNCTDLGA